MQAETLRRIPDETVADLIAAQMPRIVQPSRYGGFEMGWDVLCESTMELARGCGSQAWVANIFSEHNFLVGLFDDQAQQEVWGRDSETLVSSSFMPVGNKVRTVDGGFVVDGRWPFSSGVHHAAWTIVGDMVPLEGAAPEHHFFLVPAKDRKIVDDWHVVGLAGTGSCAVELNDVFVPRHRALPNRLVAVGSSPGTDVNTAPLFRMPMIGFSHLALGSVPVSVAQGMTDDFVAFTKARFSRAKPPPAPEGLLMRLAESAAEVQAARLLILNAARANMTKLADGKALVEADAAVTRRDSAFAVLLTKRAATRLYEATGAHGIYLDGRMQRGFRDVIASGAHAGLNWDRAAVEYGRTEAALPDSGRSDSSNLLDKQS